MSSVIEEIVKLQTASAEQTAASQALAQEVAGKIGDIDKKANEVIAKVNAAIPTAVDDELYQELHLDTVNGDDLNDGSRNQPFKTINALINHLPVGGTARVSGPENQIINIDSRIEQVNKNVLINLANLTINVNSYYDIMLGSLKIAGKPIINQNIDHFIRFFGSKVMIYSADIRPSPNAVSLVGSGHSFFFGDSMSSFQLGGQGGSTVSDATNPYSIIDVFSYDLAVLSLIRYIQLGTNVTTHSSRLKSLQVGSSSVYLLGA